MTPQAFASELLTFIERRESRLLTWGFYDVRQSAQEIENALTSEEAPPELRDAWATLAENGETIGTLLQRLERAGLVFAVPGSLNGYRSRFAEGVRLTANLRQRFSDNDWATGPRLVSDVKIDLAARTYPRRDVPSAQVWSRLEPSCRPDQRALLQQCFEALASGRDGRPLMFSGFQDRAFAHIFQKYGESGASGSVVSAGTGSGKTKAFYIPALLRVASELSSQPFTKIIAVYPRNVLLADQLREAVSESLKLLPVLRQAGIRPIRIGALLGSTPRNNWFSNSGRRRPVYYWPTRGSAAVIPYLASPIDGRSELVWRDADRLSGRTCLFREGQTNPDVPDGLLAITREQLIENPPDILFLSLEMLNREMGNPQWHRTLGIRQGSNAPRLVLLDEVHAYEGTHGAQVSWVLRRWRHWSQTRSLHVVGLSATLADAPQHLARVAGLSAAQVTEFAPIPGTTGNGEMESEGVEYNMAVKGDPAAGAALLATSIQTGMLLTRLLTPRTQAASSADADIKPEVFFRRKVFGFSDNLDSINRWYSDMTDAESNLRLARFRLPLDRRQPPLTVTADIARRMEVEGQIWQLPVQLGHDLSQPLTVSRCSSQDPGADVNSDLIIATSSLEVGFDDPEVGAMLHHKRPGSMASFIQRKGRAGRTRGSRPWTVVVLSDYGTDRLAFQSAERLFRPEVDALFLPIANPFVLRVQAALFLVDWIGQRVGTDFSPYQYLAKPDPRYREARQAAIRLLRGILELGQTWQQFRRDLLRFYMTFSGTRDPELAGSQVDDLLWQEPRPLLTQGVPTLLRKLETEWARAGEEGGLEDEGADRPMPQLVPRATFLDLDVSEAEIRLQPFRNIERDSVSMPLAQLLREVCPGRVSKRFATIPNEPGYWHPFSTQLVTGTRAASVQQLFPERFLVEVVDGIRVYQPESVNLVHRPNTVEDSSNSSWQWEKVGRSIGTGVRLPVLLEAPWNAAFSSASAYLHADGSWIELVRFSRSCTFETSTNQPPRRNRGSLTLESQGEGGVSIPEAVGFRTQADGFRFSISSPYLDSRPELSDATIERLRPEYFLHLLKASPALQPLINSFQADWLGQLSIAMLSKRAGRERITLQEAQARLTGVRRAEAGLVLDTIFQIRGILPSGQTRDPKLRQVLLDLLAIPAIEAEILRLEPVLWEPLDAEFRRWTRECFAATLGQGLRSAICAMSEQVSEDDLAVDVINGDAGVDIFISELSSGGLGQAEAVVREVKRNPRRFLDAVEFALKNCSRAETAADLGALAQRVVSEAREGGPLWDAFTGWRAASGFSEQEDAAAALRAAVNADGTVPRRSLVVSIASKLLRPGSSGVTDALIAGLNRSWARASSRLGVQIPMRTFAYLAASFAPLRRRLDTIFLATGATTAPSDAQVYVQLQQLLFERCEDSCTDCLDGSPFEADYRKPSRSIALQWLDLQIPRVSITEPDWTLQALQSLRTSGRVCISAEENAAAELSRAVLAITSQELDREGLFIPIMVHEIRRSGGLINVSLRTRDLANG